MATETGLKYFLWLIDSKVVPIVFTFPVRSQSLKASLTYNQCQLKLLQDKTHHKKSKNRVLKTEANSNHSSLRHEISFMAFDHISSLFLKSNIRVLMS